jgi:hypothetical protein
MNNAREKKTLAVILVVGFLLRVWICFFTHLPNMHRDSHEYYTQADTLLSGGYTNFFPNGYPLIMAIAKLVAGSASNTFLLWVNIAFSTLTVWFTWDIAKRVFPNPLVAPVAAALVALFPSQLNYVRWLTSEVPTLFFLLGAYFFYYRKQYARSGVFFALSIFVRTNIAPIPIILLAIKAIRDKHIPWRLAAGNIAPLLLIGFYCFLKTGEFSIAGNNQINILYAVTAKGDSVDFSLNRKHPEINTSGKAMKMYVSHMVDHPLEFVGQKWANYWELWGFYPTSARGTRGMGSRLLLGAGNFFMVVFGLIGWWLHRRLFAANLLMLPFLTVTAIHVLLFALTRYTYPVEPFMILLAAAGIVKAIKQKAIPVGDGPSHKL